MVKTPSDDELYALILKLEDELDEAGIDPDKRAWELPRKAMRELGYVNYVLSEGSPPQVLFDRIRSMHLLLYRPKDVAAGAIHGGAFMFRGIATLIEIPMMFGEVNIDLLKLCDLTQDQITWLSKRPNELQSYCDTVHDLLDFAGGFFGMGGFDLAPEESMPFFFLARSHLHAAAATLCAALDTRGCTQSAILGSELALKAAIAGTGAQERDLRSFGHDLDRMANAVADCYPVVKRDQLLHHVALLPPFVANRYSMKQPTRREAGAIVMSAQFIAAEAMRGAARPHP